MSGKFRFVDKNGRPFSMWERTTLKHFLTESRIKGSNGKEAKKLTVKLYGKGVIAKKEVLSGSENTQYFIRQAGQFIYGKLDFLNGAFGLIPSALDGFESTLDSPSFDLDGINSKFLLELVSRKEFYLKNGRKANGSRVAKRIHPEDFLSMSVTLPSLIEQKKIAEFCTLLDERIALTGEQLKLLKEQKQGYLQKVFNQELVFIDNGGSRYPDWEYKKLGEIATNSAKKYDPTKSNQEYRCVELENLNSGGLGIINGWFNSLNQKSIKNYFNSGDVLLCKLRPYLKKWARPDFNGVCSSEIWVISPKNQTVSSAYLYALIQSPGFQKDLIDITSGTKMPRADWGIVSSSRLAVPSLPEQEKIAEFFCALDERIKLHENRLKLLQEQKKGYLQGIFG